MTTYRLKLQVLTPLHIGSGEHLRKDFDFVVHQKRTWRLDVDRVLQAHWDQWQRQGRSGNYPAPGKLLTPADFQNRALFRYVLPGVPVSGKTYAELQTFIKDPWDRPYIPGSSLKGAIRTALAWAGWPEAFLRLERNAIGRRAKFAGQKLEKRLFGRDPNHDLLRALQVSDLFGPQKPGEGLVVVQARVMSRQGFAAPISLECAVQATFEGTMKIDAYLLGPAAGALGFTDRAHWLSHDFLPRLRRYAAARLEHLAQQMERFAAPGAAQLADYFRRLLHMQREKLPANSTFLALGWGTGWDGKTFWTHLQEDPFLFDKLVRDFRLQRRPRGAPRRNPGDPFPATRRVVVKHDRAAAPFGWVLLEVRPA